MKVETRVRAINCLHFTNGQFVDSQNKKSFKNINPATEEVLGYVAEDGKAEVDYAVAAARKALNGKWKNTTLEPAITIANLETSTIFSNGEHSRY